MSNACTSDSLRKQVVFTVQGQHDPRMLLWAIYMPMAFPHLRILLYKAHPYMRAAGLRLPRFRSCSSLRQTLLLGPRNCYKRLNYFYNHSSCPLTRPSGNPPQPSHRATPLWMAIGAGFASSGSTLTPDLICDFVHPIAPHCKGSG